MDDQISRQEAIDELVRWGKIPEYNEAERIVLGSVIGMLSALPSARKKGSWLDEAGNSVQLDADGAPLTSVWCSECGEWLTASDEYAVKGRWCPNCGADMRGNDNG